MFRWSWRFLSIILLSSGVHSVNAMPILSTDGSRLSGLEVDGTVYDVSFKDGVLSELFPVSLVQSPGWYELANSMIAAIADALAAIDPLPQQMFELVPLFCFQCILRNPLGCHERSCCCATIQTLS